MMPTARRHQLACSREVARDSLHLLVLANFAVAQPLFDLLGRNAQFFATRRSEPADLFLLTALLCIGLPALLVAVEAVAGLLGRVVRRTTHGVLVALLATAIALPALKRVGELPGWLVVLDAAVVGVVFTVAYARVRALGTVLTVLSVAPLVFAGVFLFGTPVRRMAFPERSPVGVVPRVTATTPVVLVVFDELSSTTLMDEHHQIDPVRFPNFAALARKATWFRNATTVSDETVSAVPAILTGRYPDGVRMKLPTSADHPRNLFTLLGGSYEMRVIEPVTSLCPEILCGHSSASERGFERIRSLLSDLTVVYLHVLLPSDLVSGLPAITQKWNDFSRQSAARQTDVKSGAMTRRASLLRQFTASIGQASRPPLFFLHVELPHVPWRYLPSGKVYETVDEAEFLDGWRAADDTWEDDEVAVRQGFQRYLLQVGAVDTLLGEIFARLEAVGLYDRAIIVITADHGVSFRPGEPRRSVTQSNFRDIMPVPLLIKAPGQRNGVVSDRNVETIDILPTIADVLGTQLPWEVDGHSALATTAAERPRKLIVNKRSGVVLAFGPSLDEQYRTVDWMLSLVRGGAGGPRSVDVSMYRDLVGRRTDGLNVSRATDIATELVHGNLYDDLRLTGVFVPVRVKGRVTAERPPRAPLEIAVAVNGTIQAVTRTRRWTGRTAKFSAFVPETTFRPGKNDVEIFVLSRAGGQITIERTRRTGSSYSFVARGPRGGGAAIAMDDKIVPVVPRALVGWVDSATATEEGLTLTGWAIARAGGVAASILVFVDGKFAYAGAPTVSRPDVAALHHDPTLAASGFAVDLPSALFRDLSDAEIRVFALSKDDLASELGYLQGYRWSTRR